MSDDAIAGPSLLLVRHDLAHREHQHLHQHRKLHKKQDDTQAAAVTEVVATVSVVQQIDIDANGNTVSMILVPASTEDPSPSLTDSSPTIATIPTINSAASTVASTVASPPSSNPSAQSPLPSSSSPSAPAPTITPSISSSFSSLIASSNSTTLISSSSSLSHAFSNSTRSSSSSRSSLTYLKSSSSSKFDDSTIKSTSSYYFPSSSLQATSTDAGAFIAGGAGATSGAASSSTSEAGSGSGSSGTEPATPTPIIIGATVSSVAGAAVIILAILFIWRWKKRSRNMLSLGSGGNVGGVDTIQAGDPTQPSGGMVERRSLAYAVPAALASLTGYKRSSQKTETDRTISSTAGSERGFYRVSGRKLPSVLQSGGDGYGGGINDLNANTLSGSSFYRDSHGFYGGPGSPSLPPVGISIQLDSGVPVMRPSPARTPVTEHGPFSSVPPPLTPPARRPDVLGRSHPSQDGSHASKFTEEV